MESTCQQNLFSSNFKQHLHFQNSSHSKNYVVPFQRRQRRDSKRSLALQALMEQWSEFGISFGNNLNQVYIKKCPGSFSQSIQKIEKNNNNESNWIFASRLTTHLSLFYILLNSNSTFLKKIMLLHLSGEELTVQSPVCI